MKKVNKLAIILMFAMAWMLPGSALAEEYEANDQKDDTGQAGYNVQQLEDIVVQEDRTEESISAPKLKAVGHQVDLLTSKEIKDAGFVDLAKALEAMVPGLYAYTRSGRGGYNTISLHGSDDILWLVDGVRINKPGSGGKGYSMTIGVHTIERVEILKGGESLFYGTDSRAGVINIITKSIGDEAGGEFGVSYGEQEYREVYGHATETIGGHGLLVFGSSEGYGGYQVCDDQAYQDALNTNKPKDIRYDRSNIGLKYRKKFDLAGKSALNFHLQKNHGHFDYPYPQYKVTFSDFEEEIGILKWDHTLNKNFSYNVRSHFHRWWSEATFMYLDGTYLGGSAGGDAAQWGFEDYGVNLMTSFHWGEGHEVISGADYQNYWGKDEYSTLTVDPRSQVYGFFANYRPYLSFLPRTKTSMGIRYNTIDGTGSDSTVWDVSLWTPIVGEFFLRGKVGTSFTNPTGRQLYYDDPANNRYGNPDLKPEESFDTEVGIGANWSLFRFEVGYFQQEVKDMISSVTLSSGIRTYENEDGTTKIHGAEMSTGIGPFAGVSLNLSATWVTAEDEDTGEQLEKVASFFGKANLQYRSATGRFGANLMTQYTGDMWERGLGDLGDINYGDFYITDVSAFINFGKARRHRLTLRVENVFDKEYATVYNRTRNDDGDYFVYHQYGLPRSIVAGYSYTF